MINDEAITIMKNSDLKEKGGALLNYIFFLMYMKRNKTMKPFGDPDIEKHKFHYHKNLISIDDVDIDKILISNKISCSRNGFKYFIGYKVINKLMKKRINKRELVLIQYYKRNY